MAKLTFDENSKHIEAETDEEGNWVVTSAITSGTGGESVDRHVSIQWPADGVAVVKEEPHR